jgi:NitT/TauT family transport system ATP-binding protein
VTEKANSSGNGSGHGTVALHVDSLYKDYPVRGTAKGAAQPVNTVLSDVTVSVADGEFVSVVGPSGCGKSTLLLCVLGLIRPTSGAITVGGVVVDGPGVDRAMVFQHASLLPWRTVLGNAAFGLELQGATAGPARKDLARTALDRVGLAKYETYYPHQLSGGMQQRVNLARALATEPDLLLMDEPFGALDALTKRNMQDELGRIVATTNCTTLFITHDIEEAVLLSDRVLVMAPNPGRITHELVIPLPRPRSPEVADDPRVRQWVAELRERITTQPEHAVGALA